ncbi:ACC synthase [Colletotrichum plurivorum]|uniref:ACC synthase n=1 Tax=Colletotrichum plurivorum TaxID=2175906 RepID=A0A8H6KVY0_9PEZI|nr:ACC synthase [Colletotrichum plurivorum]
MDHGLSSRGREAIKPDDNMMLWTILRDLWDPKSNTTGYVSLGVAENSLMHERLSEHIHKNLALPNHSLTYGDGMTGSKRLKASLARFMMDRFNPASTIQPEHVTITNGCSSALEHLAWALGNPGDGFLLGQPHYGNYYPDVEYRMGCKIVQVPFDDVDPLELAPCRIIIELMRVCQKYDMHLISDENYALSVWQNNIDSHPPPVPFESCLFINMDGIMDAHRLHILWGMSKDFGANGIRLGALVSQHNPSLHSALTPVAIYSSPSSISDHVTANMLDDREWVDGYIEENRRKLQEHYEVIVSWAKENAIPYAPGNNAAFFVWVDLGKAYCERHPGRDMEDISEHVMRFLLDQKVFLACGKQFGSEQPGWLRIVFSVDKELLGKGLSRIVAALDG